MSIIFVQAKVRIIATATGRNIHPTADLVIEYEVGQESFNWAVSNIDRQREFFVVLESSVRESARQEFIKYLRANPAIKRNIGGTKWDVALVGDITTFPIYLDKQSVGTIDKLIRPGAHRRESQIVARNYALADKLFYDLLSMADEEDRTQTSATQGA